MPTACGICGTEKLREVSDPRLRHMDSARWVECGACGVAMLRAFPNAQELERWYTQDISGKTPPPLLGNSSEKERLLQRLARAHAGSSWPDLFWRFALHPLHAHFQGLPSQPAPGKILDIGCGDGHWLAVMQSLGWSVQGIEQDPRRASTARARGVLVWVGNVADYPWDGVPYDVIRLWHVIEHLPEPKTILSRVNPWLRPGGELIVGVPNLNGLMHKVFRKNWSGLEYPKHLFHFTSTGLDRLIRSSGFAQTRIRFLSCGTFLDSLGLKFGSKGLRVASSFPVRLASIYLDRFLDLFRASDALEARATKPHAQ